MTDDGEKKSEDDKQTDEENRKATAEEGIEDVILEIAWKDFTASAEDKRVLDTKATTILVASGVLLGLIINGIELMDVELAIISAGFLIITSIFCVLALSLRTYSGLGAMKTWNALASEGLLTDPIQAKRNIMATIDKVVEDNRAQTQKIANLIKPANYLFIAALAFLALAVVLHYTTLLCSCNTVIK